VVACLTERVEVSIGKDSNNTYIQETAEQRSAICLCTHYEHSSQGTEKLGDVLGYPFERVNVEVCLSGAHKNNNVHQGRSTRERT